MHDNDRYVLVYESADCVPVRVQPMSDLAEARRHLRSIADRDRGSWYILDLLENRKLTLEPD